MRREFDMTKAIGNGAVDEDGPGGLASIIAEFELITRRDYGQFCAVSRAVEAVGERWGLLIIRDLLVSPKTRAQLREGLPRIPADVLGARLREFERDGIARSVREPDGEIRYELTPYGQELEEITLALGRWGGRLLNLPRPGEIITVNAVITAMRASFDIAAARGVRVSYQISLGDFVLNLLVEDGTLAVGVGPMPDADLLLSTGAELKALMFGELDPREGIATGALKVAGDPDLLVLFTKLFHIDT
jgi:DNA-binding HxlR family transcriptional regulator